MQGALSSCSVSTIADRKENSFDSLRLLFAILVIFSHSFPLTLGSNAQEPLARLTAPAMVRGDEITFGAVSVWAFFVISGFLITKSWQRNPSVWPYLKKRVKRIYPGFIVAISLCAVLQAIFGKAGSPCISGSWNFLSHSLRLQMYDNAYAFGDNPFPGVINGSLWSIPYEFWCYLGVLFLGITCLLERYRLISVVFLAVVACHLWIDYRHWLPGGMLLGAIFGFPLFWVRILPFFLAGMFIAVARDKIELRPDYALISALLVVAATPLPYLPHLIYPIAGSYLLLYLAFSPALAWMHLGRWGDFSYGTYLYAFPIQQLLVHLSRGKLTAIELFFAATPLSLGAGALSWFFVERRFLLGESEKRHMQRIPTVWEKSDADVEARRFPLVPTSSR